MRILENFKSKQFWVEVLKLFLVFFIVFTIMFVLIDQFRNIISGNFSQVYENLWSEGKWKSDIGIKAAISFVYAIYMVSRRKRAFPRQN